MKYANRTRLTANSFFPGGKFLFLGLLAMELFAMAGVIELQSTWELRMLLPIRWGKLRTFVEWGSGRADSYFNCCCPSSKRSKDEWSCDIEFPKVISELNFDLCFFWTTTPTWLVSVHLKTRFAFKPWDKWLHLCHLGGSSSRDTCDFWSLSGGCN